MNVPFCQEKLSKRRIASLVQPYWAVSVYLFVLVALWATIYVGGDRYWLPTVLMFGPKWIYAVPIPFLIVWIAAARAGCKCWLTLVCAVLVLLFPVSRFCVPLNLVSRGDARSIRILSFNARGGDFDASRFQDLLNSAVPDVVCIQEVGEGVRKTLDAKWSVHQAGQLLVASRLPMVAISTLNRRVAGRWPRPICQVVAVTLGEQSIYVATVHPLSPRRGLADITSRRTLLAPSRRGTLEAEIAVRRDEHRRIRREVGALEGPVLIVGDFNAPTSSSIYRECWTTFLNAFSKTGFGFGHTILIEEGNVRFSARIDHVLASTQWIPLKCWVGPDVGSDHRPLVADFRLGPEG
jgi:endonuclease/exonuclease/phosphatase (EEP) superfamily protein YafD